MEAVSLDHYVGRKVEDVNKRSGAWQLILEGGIKIICYDENYDMPEKEILVDKIFQAVTLRNETTQLYFGTQDNPSSTTMTLPPLEYAIVDPDRTSGEPVRPQEGGYLHDPEEDRPDEPVERIADEPAPDEPAPAADHELGDAESDSEGA